MAAEPSEATPPPAEPLYRRVLVKVSGEAMMGAGEYGHEPEAIARIADDLAEVHRAGMQLCLVIGGGNIFRGVAGAAAGMERAAADSMGMLATVINALALQSALEARSVPTRVQSAIHMAAICEPYIRRRAVRHMEKGRAVIFAAGIGSPYFTTDTAAALRAVEMNCDVILKGTQVDGVYSADPKTDKTAKRYDRLSFSRVLRDDLKVMDASAISLARDNRIPIIVFSLLTDKAIFSVLGGKGQFTLISGEE